MSEFKASMVYIVSARTDRITKRYSVSTPPYPPEKSTYQNNNKNNNS